MTVHYLISLEIHRADLEIYAYSDAVPSNSRYMYMDVYLYK